jgi:hypothetical protein
MTMDSYEATISGLSSGESSSVVVVVRWPSDVSGGWCAALSCDAMGGGPSSSSRSAASSESGEFSSQKISYCACAVRSGASASSLAGSALPYLRICKDVVEYTELMLACGHQAQKRR